MDQISIAIEKARKLRQENVRPSHDAARSTISGPNGKESVTLVKASLELPRLHLDPETLESSRLVSHVRRHTSHVAFDMLRTKVSYAMASHGWTSLAVTSPTPACGKSVVALNLAFSMAHQPDRTVVLVDLDLRAPRIADMVGHRPAHRFADYLEGRAELTDLCVRATDNLILCLNSEPIRRPAEWMRHDKISKLPSQLKETFGAGIIVFDLPPALTTDDVMVFCPFVDSVMLVAAAGETTAREIEEAERQLTLSNYLGVVLNKALGSDIKPYSDNAYNRRS